MNRAPWRFSTFATRYSRSGGLHACTTSTGPTLRACRSGGHCAVPYSCRLPAGPPVAAFSGYRWMWTPSTTASASVSRLMPCGQITWTSQPASRRVVDSCQTRRSKGTDRFSTRMSALPGKAGVSLFKATRLGVGQADEGDEHAVVRQGRQHVRVLGADEQDVGVVHDIIFGRGV